MSVHDQRHMAAAIALASRGRGRATPNPNVGCIIVAKGRVVGRGWTQPGGRPHAESMALAQAGAAARGATAYATLEPCAHASARGPACSDALIAAGVARVVVATQDPDPRTDGQGIARLRAAGIAVSSDVLGDEARAGLAGWWSRTTLGRAHVTLKLATSLDGCIAMADGSSRWITGDRARAHAHLLRARNDAILVGRGTWEADAPALNVRLAGLEDRAPVRVILSRTFPAGGGGPSEGWWRGSGPPPSSHRAATPPPLRGPPPRAGESLVVPSPEDAVVLAGINDLLVEGGAGAAAAFLAADVVDTLVLYRAPILIGGGRAALGDIGLGELGAAHGRWRLADARQLGDDRMETYERMRTA